MFARATCVSLTVETTTPDLNFIVNNLPDQWIDLLAEPYRMARVMALFGTGGHSAEMLMLIRNCKLMQKLDGDDISRLSCVISEDDQLVVQKLNQELSTCKKKSKVELIRLNRARRVGQSYVSSIWTTLVSIFQALRIVIEQKPQLCLTNGPAISVTVLLAIRFLQLITFYTNYKCLVIYVESFCRTKTLSLSGKIVYHLRLADQFYVQWSFLHEKYPRTLCKGIIV